MVGLSPSPPPTGSSTSKTRSRSVPLSSAKISNSPASSKLRRHHRKSKTPKPTLSEQRERTPAPPNKFSLRDSDISDTSSEEELLETDVEDDYDLGRRRTRGGSAMLDHDETTPKRRTNAESRWSVDPERMIGPPSLGPNRPQRTREQTRQQQEFVNAVRLRQRKDPVQDYEAQARRESWQVAHDKNKEEWKTISSLIDSTPSRAAHNLAALEQAQLDEVQRVFRQLSLVRRQEEERAKVEESAADREMREASSIERSISLYEADARAIEAERLRTQRAAEEKARQEREALEQQERLRRQILEEKQKKAEEEERKKKEEEQRRKEEEEKARREAEAEKNERSMVVPKNPLKELLAHEALMRKIKTQVMPSLKVTKLNPDFVPDPQTKRSLNQARRAIIPKIGQITNSWSVIERVTSEIQSVLTPSDAPPRSLSVTLALHYLLSKAVLKQAEVEVTAKPSTAFPLARVMVRLVEQNPGLGGIFMAKLVQMTGPWVVGLRIPQVDGQSEDEYRISQGMKSASSGETTSQYIDRMAGLVYLYSAMLQLPPTSIQPSQAKDDIVPGSLLLPRIWTYLSRLISEPYLMSLPPAPHVLAAIIEAAGDVALVVFGKQMVKLSNAIRMKCEMADRGDPNPIGGSDAEGKAGRVKLLLLMERWQKEGMLNPKGATPAP